MRRSTSQPGELWEQSEKAAATLAHAVFRSPQAALGPFPRAKPALVGPGNARCDEKAKLVQAQVSTCGSNLDAWQCELHRVLAQVTFYLRSARRRIRREETNGTFARSYGS